MQNDYLIKKASEEHAVEACHVLIRSITEVCIVDHNNDSAVLQEWLNNKTPDNIKKWINDKSNYSIVVLDKQKKVIGFSIISIHGEILLTYLLPEYLFQGIGKMMLNNLELFASKIGIKKITVMSTITALQFYKANGFIDCPEDNEGFCIYLIKNI